MSKYIIQNCPALQQTYYCNTHHSKCQDCTDCLLKQIYEDVKTVYRTSEYFEELAEKGDRGQEIIESCWHNVAHMVISKLDIQDILE